VPRPKRCRKVCFDPNYKIFKPQGIPMSELSSIEMELDELEAMRLSDVENLSQTDAAKMMDVSQPTFNRILSGARSKVAEALTEGMALRIARGSPHAPGPSARAAACKTGGPK
jgi:predicted DNA-binding protein (UPF0251 family)